MPFCGKSATKSSKPVQAAGNAGTRALDMAQNNNNNSAVKPVEVRGNNSADEALQAVKADEDKQHAADVVAWEDKFKNEVQTVKQQSKQQHAQEVTKLQEHHQIERAHKEAEKDVLRRQITELKSRDNSVVYTNEPVVTRTLPVTHSTTKYQNEIVPTGNGLPDTKVTYSTISEGTVPATNRYLVTETAPTTTSTYNTSLPTTYSTALPTTSTVYQNEIIPTGNGLPDTKITYTTISDNTTTVPATSHYTTSSTVISEPVTTHYTSAPVTNYSTTQGEAGDYQLVNGHYVYGGTTTYTSDARGAQTSASAVVNEL